MPVYRCHRQLLPAFRGGVAAHPSGYGVHAGGYRVRGFRKSGVKRFIAAALPLVSTSCAFAATRPLHARIVTLEQLHGQAALIGQEVELVSCAGIPLSDAPHEEDVIIIYPCGAKLDEDVSKTAALGRVSAQTVFKPSKDWAIGDSPAFKGQFRGVLKREIVGDGDEEEVLVIELDEAECISAGDL